jgi:hypothetical protein
MWLKKNFELFFCTEYDNDFKFVCIKFCKLYPSFREPTEFLLVWSFLYEICNQMNIYVTEVCIMSCLCI